MTVFQKIISNVDVWDLPNSTSKVSQLSDVHKKIMTAVKIAAITIGSMSLSFYVMFLR